MPFLKPRKNASRCQCRFVITTLQGKFSRHDNLESRKGSAGMPLRPHFAEPFRAAQPLNPASVGLRRPGKRPPQHQAGGARGKV
jgi:hypothetical protein